MKSSKLLSSIVASLLILFLNVSIELQEWKSSPMLFHNLTESEGKNYSCNVMCCKIYFDKGSYYHNHGEVHEPVEYYLLSMEVSYHYEFYEIETTLKAIFYRRDFPTLIPRIIYSVRTLPRTGYIQGRLILHPFN